MVNQQKGATMDTVGTGFWGSGSVFWFQGTSVRCSEIFSAAWEAAKVSWTGVQTAVFKFRNVKYNGLEY